MKEKAFLKSNLAMYLAQNGWDIMTEQKNENTIVVTLDKYLKNTRDGYFGTLTVEIDFTDDMDKFRKLRNRIREVTDETCPTISEQDSAVILYETGEVKIPHEKIHLKFEESPVRVWAKVNGQSNKYLEDYGKAGRDINEELHFIQYIFSKIGDYNNWFAPYFDVKPVIGKTVRTDHDPGESLYVTEITNTSITAVVRTEHRLSREMKYYRKEQKNVWCRDSGIEFIPDVTVALRPVKPYYPKTECEKLLRLLKNTDIYYQKAEYGDKVCFHNIDAGNYYLDVVAYKDYYCGITIGGLCFEGYGIENIPFKSNEPYTAEGAFCLIQKWDAEQKSREKLS